MRIISGTARGTKLRSVADAALRPMLDRVKESLFGILRNMLHDARVLDLFSGSGSLGLEALSRGAQSCVFVEHERALCDLIAENAGRTRLAGRCEVVRADVLDLPQRLPTVQGVPGDMVFVDPPYALVDDPNGRERLFRALEGLVSRWVGPGAVVVLHHRPIPHALWPTTRFVVWDRRTYGRSQLTFFDVAEEDTESG